MDILALEQQRQVLEQNLQKLRAALKHWQTSAAEYEGLKEEIREAAEDLDLESISRSYNGSVVDQKEIREIAGLPGSPRSVGTIIGLVSRRQDYVQQNIETLQRQFWDAEAKLEELDFAAFSAGRDAGTGGLPLTEIYEELDDDGNVISSSVSQPEVASTKLVDALRKAGLSDRDIDNTDASAVSDGEEPASVAPTSSAMPPSALVNRTPRVSNDHSKTSTALQTTHHDESERPAIRKKAVSFTADTKPPPQPLRQDSDGPKSVSFNDKVAVMPAAPPADTRSVSFAPKVEEIPVETPKTTPDQTKKTGDADVDFEMQKTLRGFMFKPGERVGEVNQDDELAATHVVIPEVESEEDAATRREMLEYHLNEVGHVVAQMDLDDEDMDIDEGDSNSDFAFSEHLDEDTPYTSGLSDSDEESEDEFGRTKRRLVSDDYHKEMQELERRLIGNIGPAPTSQDIESVDPDLNPQDVRKLVIRGTESAPSDDSAVSQEPSAGRKRVSFASDIDVDASGVGDQAPKQMRQGENKAPISNDTVKQDPVAAPNKPVRTSKLSRFKQDRQGQHSVNSAPSGPPDKIIANELVERPMTPAAAPSEDGLDPITQRRELAAEYYRRRNEIIRQQGGFKSSKDEDDLEELEARDGKVKKVSLFKAGRIR